MNMGSSHSLRIRVTSELAATREALWEHVTSMSGINEELWPFRMSAPRDRLGNEEIQLGKVLFTSVVTLFGVIPVDVHRLAFVHFEPGVGFAESSTTLLESSWKHRRTLTPIPGGCRVDDDVEFQPRVRLLKPLILPIVKKTFRRRHEHLRARFGVTATTSAGTHVDVQVG